MGVALIVLHMQMNRWLPNLVIVYKKMSGKTATGFTVYPVQCTVETMDACSNVSIKFTVFLTRVCTSMRIHSVYYDDDDVICVAHVLPCYTYVPHVRH